MIGGDAVDRARDETLHQRKAICCRSQRRIHLEPLTTFELVSILDVETEVVRCDFSGDMLSTPTSFLDDGESIRSREMSDVGVNVQLFANRQDRSDRLDLRFGWTSLLMGRAVSIGGQDRGILGMKHHDPAAEGRQHLGDRGVTPGVDVTHAGPKITLPGDVVAIRSSPTREQAVEHNIDERFLIGELALSQVGVCIDGGIRVVGHVAK